MGIDIYTKMQRVPKGEAIVTSPIKYLSHVIVKVVPSSADGELAVVAMGGYS